MHTCIHNRLVLQGKAGSLHEGRHKAKLDAMFTNWNFFLNSMRQLISTSLKVVNMALVF